MPDYGFILTAKHASDACWSTPILAWLADVGLHACVGDWERSVRTAPGVIEVQTRLEVKVNGHNGEVMVEAERAHFAYGWPVL